MSLASACTDYIKTEAEGIYDGCDLTSTDFQEKNVVSDNLEELLALYTNKQEKRRIGGKRMILNVRRATIPLYISLL